jgi:hypothetical protein
MEEFITFELSGLTLTTTLTFSPPWLSSMVHSLNQLVLPLFHTSANKLNKNTME